MKNTEKTFFLKKVFSIGIITFVSRVFGLLREMVITALLGTSLYSDAFYLAYAIPNLFRRFSAEGAMLSTFIPVFTKLHQTDQNYAKKFSANFFWSLALLLTVFCLVFLFFTPQLLSNVFARGFQGATLEQSIFFTRIMFFYILLISLTAVYQSILNYHSLFFPSAFSPVLLNIVIIIGGLVIGRKTENAALGLSIGVLLGGLTQLLYSHFSAYKLQYPFFRKITLFDKEVRRAFRKMLGGIFSAGIYQLNIIIGYSIASSLYTGSIASLTISNRLIEFSLGILIVSITTVLLPQLAKLVAAKKISLAKEKLQEALLFSSFITLPATIGLLLTGEYIIRILFFRGNFGEHSVELTNQALLFHTAGLFFIAWNRILTSNLHSFQLFQKPAIIAFFAMLLNVFLCLQTVQVLGHAAIALASSASQAFMLILHLFVIPKELKNIFSKQFLSQFFRQILASLLLFFVIYFLQNKLFENLYLKFFSLLLISVLTYFAICYLLKIRELKNIFLILKKQQ
jgi:putative peptidoglycan lipid II flippase